MGLKPADRIIGPSRGDAGTAKAYGVSGGALRVDECREYIQAVYDICKPDDLPDAAIVIAQSLQETTEGGKPWASHWWEARLNPAGMGITGDPVENARSPTFATGEEAARAQVSHLLLYATGQIDRGGLTPADDPRYQAYISAYGHTAKATTIAGLSGTWAVDLGYATGICLRGNRCFPGLPDQDQAPNGGPPMADHTTTIPGLPGGPLITSYPITVNLIPSSNTRQRSGLTARTPRRSVQHGTGNPNNPDAAAEARWFVNGADGGTASIHYCTDDTKAVVCLPLNEVSWQAADGAGPGNMNGFSCEMMEATAIWNDFGRRDKLIAITADLMGRTAARLGASTPEQHWTFNAGSPDRHDCPNKLRHTTINGQPAWDVYARQWQAARADELKRMAGGAPATPKPEYASPRKPPPWDGADTTLYGETWVAVQRQVTATKTTKRLQLFDTAGPVVGPPIPKGMSFMVKWKVSAKKGGNFLVTEWGTVVGAGNVTPLITVRERP